VRALPDALGFVRQIDEMQLAVRNIVGREPVFSEAAVLLQAR
jgi:hypothetical protein